MKKNALLILAILFFAACSGNHDFSPKPRGYYRIVFPKRHISLIYPGVRSLFNILNMR
jgi:hypothetical protein